MNSCLSVPTLCALPKIRQVLIAVVHNLLSLSPSEYSTPVLLLMLEHHLMRCILGFVDTRDKKGKEMWRAKYNGGVSSWTHITKASEWQRWDRPHHNIHPTWEWTTFGRHSISSNSTILRTRTSAHVYVLRQL